MRKPFITVRLTHGMLGALLVSTCACSGTKWTEVEKDSTVSLPSKKELY